MQKYAKLALNIAREQDKYVVLDADALWMVQNDPKIVKGYSKAILTPNIVEFKRLSDTLVCRGSFLRYFFVTRYKSSREFPPTPLPPR